jgi:ATP-dependent Lon protease
VKWIDRVLDLTLERKPEALPEQDAQAPQLTPVAEPPAPAAIKH